MYECTMGLCVPEPQRAEETFRSLSVFTLLISAELCCFILIVCFAVNIRITRKTRWQRPLLLTTCI